MGNIGEYYDNTVREYWRGIGHGEQFAKKKTLAKIRRQEIFPSWSPHIRSASKRGKEDCLCHRGVIHHVFERFYCKPSDWCSCDSGSAPALLFPCLDLCNLSLCWGLPHPCNDLLDIWTGLVDCFCLCPLHVGQTIKAPTSRAATGRPCTSKRSASL